MPQCVSVRVDVSQPLGTAPSQFPKPGSHMTMSHVPEPQVSVALLRAHATPHPPQSVSVRVDVSQSRSDVLQSSNPALHAMRWQVPPLHDRSCSSIAVVDRDERLLGMLSDRDVAMAALTRARLLRDITAGEVMSRAVETCRPGDPVELVQRRMTR